MLTSLFNSELVPVITNDTMYTVTLFVESFGSVRHH